MKVLVTGTAGFLGHEIASQLIARGDNVVGLARRACPDLEELGMVWHRGDLTDDGFVARAVSDVDAVVHTAAVAGVWGPADYFYRNNVVATENVIAACRAAEIPKLVFTSSPSVTFDGGDQRGIDESAPYPATWLCHYPRTKAIAERLVLAADQRGGLRTVALRPHLIWGSGDPHLLPRLLDRARSGRLRIVGSGKNRVDTVHVVNAAAAHLDAIDALTGDPERAAGRAYFIAQDEPVNCWDWIAEICRIGGVQPPRRRISGRAAYFMGAILEAAYHGTGKRTEPPMTRFVAAQLARDHFFDITAAKERLGYHVRVDMSRGLQQLRADWAGGVPVGRVEPVAMKPPDR